MLLIKQAWNLAGVDLNFVWNFSTSAPGEDQDPTKTQTTKTAKEANTHLATHKVFCTLCKNVRCLCWFHVFWRKSMEHQQRIKRQRTTRGPVGGDREAKATTAEEAPMEPSELDLHVSQANTPTPAPFVVQPQARNHSLMVCLDLDSARGHGRQ